MQSEEYDDNGMTEVLDDPFIPRIELVQENNDNHYWISTNIVKFGRYPECDGVIDESFVSGEHLNIVRYAIMRDNLILWTWEAQMELF
ncbi:hypothetical protein [Eubacterium aggregans]|uniref:hypothetical protein n=1 Tax=Eubacterium aggregans TaxID=81409 RepID=UPI003F3DFCF9